MIQSQIFTRKYAPEKKKSRFSMGSSKPKTQEEQQDPKMTFRISIGDVVMCKWSGDEENWESKSSDPAEFPYTEANAT